MPKGNVFFTACVATFGSSLMCLRIFADGEELTYKVPFSHHKKALLSGENSNRISWLTFLAKFAASSVV